MTKRAFVLLGVLALLLIVATGVWGETVVSQNRPLVCDGRWVQGGDTLWAFDPVRWRELAAKNPWLEEMGRVRPTPNPDLIYVLIHSGECIVGARAEDIKSEMPALPEYRSEALMYPEKPAAPVAATASSEAWFFDRWPWRFLALLAVVALAFLLYRHRPWPLAGYGRRIQSGDPATAGPPVIPGGLREDQYPAITERLDQAAIRRYGEMAPGANLMRERPIREPNIRVGTISGVGEVEYQGQRQVRNLQQVPGYEATFHYPNGTTEPVRILGGCGNVVRPVPNHREPTFTPERELTPPVQPATPPPAEMPSVASTEFQTRVVLGRIEMILPAGATMVQAPDGSIRIRMEGELTIREIAPKRARSPRPTAARPGTSQ